NFFPILSPCVACSTKSSGNLNNPSRLCETQLWSLGNRNFPPAKSLLLSQESLSRPCKNIMRLCQSVPFDDIALSPIGIKWQRLALNVIQWHYCSWTAYKGGWGWRQERATTINSRAGNAGFRMQPGLA